jgi:hypothetical protein
MRKTKLAERIRLAQMTYASVVLHRVASEEEFGIAVAGAEGRPNLYAADTVAAWTGGRVVPSFGAMRATGDLVGYTNSPSAQFGWFLFGDDHPLHAETADEFERYYRNE